MKRLTFALISDVFFFTLCAFIISFTAIRFYTNRAATALVFAVIIALTVGVIAFFALLAKRKKLIISSLGESQKKSLALHLSVCGKNQILALFSNALDGAYAQDNRLYDQDFRYFFNFKMSPLSADDIADVIRAEEEKNKCVLCCDISPDAAALAEDFSIRVITIGEIYLLLKDKQLLPEKYALGKVKRPNVFKRIKKRFNRKLCPSLFFGGISLLFLSFFTSYHVYYVVSGAVLLTLSAASLLFNQPS